MQHATTTWLLPYPDSDETANVPRDLQALAQATDDAITGSAQNSGVPVGTILMWAAEIEPARYMRCDGRSLNVADFPELFAVIGNLWGGDGVTTFSLPDLQARFPVGINDTQIDGLRSVRQAGEVGGEEKHALTVGELPLGGVFLSNPAGRSVASMEVAAGAGSGRWAPISQPTAPPAGQQGLFAINSGGNHNTMPPFLVVNFIVKYVSA